MSQTAIVWPADGEVLVKTAFISLDPAMRGWLRDAKSYFPPVALGEVMRSIEPYERTLSRQARRSHSFDVDHQKRRLAIEAQRRTSITDFDGTLAFNIDGIEPKFANAGDNIVTRSGRVLRVWTTTGTSLHQISEPGLRSWDVSEKGDVIVAVVSVGSASGRRNGEE